MKLGVEIEKYIHKDGRGVQMKLVDQKTHKNKDRGQIRHINYDDVKFRKNRFLAAPPPAPLQLTA